MEELKIVSFRSILTSYPLFFAWEEKRICFYIVSTFPPLDSGGFFCLFVFCLFVLVFVFRADANLTHDF